MRGYIIVNKNRFFFWGIRELSLSLPVAVGVMERVLDYVQHLSRVFDSLRENNPELVTGDRREGSKKTVFVNFMDICKTMHRQPEHVMAFLLAEMGTSGCLDEQHRLLVKDRFAPNNFEGILRRYIS
ncbi:hypothetical protein Dsin_017510 [Dipteronia sinensis]|uniref:Translation initiation factor IF2/IF5 domain-containing protein n=1 Tax=Dipteronia sinensis TaxID=43782 RepID=A0AAE0AFG4_9ROSI|nr:hypothetical protein Dsin_017510 [Dipteronia sinensis]